jgi:glycosyltransferase involved in cell wall biosynthesis
LDHRVELAPVTDRPADWFVGADLLVCPSYTETFPGVLLEARVAGVAVVASELPGTRSAAGTYPVTWVPPGDAAALAQALQRQLASPRGSTRSDPTVPDVSDRARRLTDLLAGLVEAD